MKDNIKFVYKVILLIFLLSVFAFSCDHNKDNNNEKSVPEFPQSKTVFLKNLKINSEKVEIKDEIDLGKVYENTVELEWETEPNDALVSFSTELENKQQNKGVWNIGGESGVNTLTITVKKEKEQHKYTLKIKREGDKPPLVGIELTSVNEVGSLEGSLPESLTLHIKDGSNPLHKYNGTSATVAFSVENKDLVSNALFKIDDNVGETVEKEVVDKETYFSYEYKIDDLKEHNIEVIFHSAKPTEYSDLICKFRLQRTGKKIKIPQDAYLFTINNVGASKLPKEVKEHLTDGSSPLYKIDGFEVNARIGSIDEGFTDMIKHIRFTFADEQPVEVSFEEIEEELWVAEASFSMKKAHMPYLLKIELIPADDQMYEPLVYSLNVQSTGVIVEMPVIFSVDWDAKPNGHAFQVDKEHATVMVQTRSDIMDIVTIEVENVDTQPVSCDIQEFQDDENKPFWEASRIINLTYGNNTLLRTVIITVKPKDATKYNEATCIYTIKGKKAARDNAKFVFEEDVPQITLSAEFKEGAQSEYYNDYGATSITITDVLTENSNATVRYAILDPKGNMIDFPTGSTPNTKYKVMQNTNGRHQAEKIELFKNKPTTVKIWVVAEDGITEDERYGLYEAVLNPISLRWSYSSKNAKTATFNDFKNKAYDLIDLEKSKIKDSKNNIYIAVQVWDSTTGFEIKDSEDQNKFEALTQTIEEKERYKQTYMLKLDVSKLKAGSENNLTFKCNMQKAGSPPVDCFTYVVKVTATK